MTSRAFCLICAGVKGWTPEVDAIEDSRRRGTDVVERDATELYIAVAARVVVAEFTQVAIRWTQAADIIRERQKNGLCPTLYGTCLDTTFTRGTRAELVTLTAKPCDSQPWQRAPAREPGPRGACELVLLVPQHAHHLRVVGQQ